MLTSKPLALAMLFSMALHYGQAQNKNKETNWVFHSINQFGLLEGESGSAFQIQSVNGMQYRTWFAGLGAGLDFYRFRSIPLFLDLRKLFHHDGKGFFLYADGGIDFVWPLESQKISAQATYKNNFFADVGLGYQLQILKTTSLLFLAGYSYKKVVENNSTPCEIGFGPCNTATDGYIYDLNRLSFKIGISF